MAVAAVVVTVMVEEMVIGVPEATIDEGVNEQAAAAGSRVQERAIVPVNPVEEEIVTEVKPDRPGAEIAIAD